jgi:hypothetical protein
MYIYMELLVKPEILTSSIYTRWFKYDQDLCGLFTHKSVPVIFEPCRIYGPMFGNAESRLFLFAPQCFNTESMQKVILCYSCV